jgi:hypothetical protein
MSLEVAGAKPHLNLRLKKCIFRVGIAVSKKYKCVREVAIPVSAVS